MTNVLFRLILRNKLIDQVLDELFREEAVSYEIVDRNILIKVESNFPGMSQQQKTVNGVVTDKSGEGLPGVTIVVKGTTNGTVTDLNGKYSLPNIAPEVTLVFSYVGMISQEIEVGGQSTINLVLEADAIGIEEVVAIGYGTIKKADVTSAVSTVKSDDFIKGAVKDAAQLVQGKVAGLSVSLPTGDPTKGGRNYAKGCFIIAWW